MHCNLVEAACWDISLGVAQTCFGRWLLQCTSGEDDESPEAVDHVGLCLFGNLYEYGDEGVLITKMEPDKPPESKYPVHKLRSLEQVGSTQVTQEDFEAWIASEADGKFAGSAYNVVTNSCVVWGILACEFLGVDFPPNWPRIIAWAEENNKVAQMVGRSGMGVRVSANAVKNKLDPDNSEKTNPE